MDTNITSNIPQLEDPEIISTKIVPEVLQQQQAIVRSEVGKNANGDITFNGKTRQQIVDYRYKELNFYQMACGPRRLENEDFDNNEIDLKSFTDIKEILHCPVCLDILKDPLNVKMCLHKFCAHCIENYNRLIKKQCPQCRKYIGSRRLLRSDYKLAYIIKALITDIDAFNKFEEQARKEEVPKIFDFNNFKNKYQVQQQVQKQKAIEADHAAAVNKKIKGGNRLNRRQMEEIKHEIDSDSDIFLDLEDSFVAEALEAAALGSNNLSDSQMNPIFTTTFHKNNMQKLMQSQAASQIQTTNTTAQQKNHQEEQKKGKTETQPIEKQTKQIGKKIMKKKKKNGQSIILKPKAQANESKKKNDVNQSEESSKNSTKIVLQNVSKAQKNASLTKKQLSLNKDVKLTGTKRTLKYSQVQSKNQQNLSNNQDSLLKGKRGRKPKFLSPEMIKIQVKNQNQEKQAMKEESSDDTIQQQNYKRQKKDEKPLATLSQQYQSQSSQPQVTLAEEQTVEYSIRQEYFSTSKDTTCDGDVPVYPIKPRFQDAILKTKACINVQQLKKYVQSKLQCYSQHHVELNQIEIYINIMDQKTQVLVNKQTIHDLVIKGLWKEEKLIPKPETEYIYSYWNSKKNDEKIREILWIKIKHPAF
eukprot:403335250